MQTCGHSPEILGQLEKALKPLNYCSVLAQLCLFCHAESCLVPGPLFPCSSPLVQRCSSLADHYVVFLSRSPRGHGQRLPEPAVRLQSLLPLRGVKHSARIGRKNTQIVAFPFCFVFFSNCTLSWEYRLLYFVSHKKKLFLDETVIFCARYFHFHLY